MLESVALPEDKLNENRLPLKLLNQNVIVNGLTKSYYCLGIGFIDFKLEITGIVLFKFIVLEL